MGGGDLPSTMWFRDGSRYVPTSLAKGPWGQFVSGQYVGGLLGCAIERDADGDPSMQLARLTIDMPQRVTMDPVLVSTAVQRQGRRVRLVDAAMQQGDGVVAHARAVFLRRGDHPDNDVWTSPVSMPALPDAPSLAPPGCSFEAWAFNSTEERGTNHDLAVFTQHAQKFMWMRFLTPLVSGEPNTPLVCAAMAGDATSGLAHFGAKGLHYINADYTLTLARLPDGPFVGLAGLTHYSERGVACGAATMFDRHGPIGSTMTVGIANGGFPDVNPQNFGIPR